MMNHIFRDLHVKHLQKGTRIIVYMDDILIATSSSLAAHEYAVHDVLRRLEEHDLYLKPEKMRVETSSVDYLGVILEKGVTRMDPVKISGIADWPIQKPSRTFAPSWASATSIEPSFAASLTSHVP